MKRILGLKTALALLVVIIVAQGCKSDSVEPWRYDLERQKHAQLVSEKQRLQDDIANLQKLIGQLNKDIERLDALRQEVQGLKDARESLKAQVGKFEAQVGKLEAQLSERDRKLENMAEALRKATGEKWTVFAGGLKVPIQGDILFDSGKADLKKSGKLPLQTLQEAVNKVLGQYQVGIEYVRIDGHTDSDPIKYSIYKSNWLLGSARADSVRRYLMELGGWKAHKMYITSFAFTMPVDRDTTKKAKAKNRRVEIYIVPAIEE